VIIGVIRDSGVGRTHLTGEQRGLFSVRLGSFAGVVANRPVPFMKKTFIVAPGAHSLTREVEDLGSEAKCDILPARWVVPGGAISVASK